MCARRPLTWACMSSSRAVTGWTGRPATCSTPPRLPLAWMPSVPTSSSTWPAPPRSRRAGSGPSEAFAVNATGVLHLLEAVADATPPVPRALRVLGRGLRRAQRASGSRSARSQPPAPVTPYGESKAAMERHLRPATRATACGSPSSAPSTSSGPGQSPAFAASGFARQIAAAELAGAEAVELSVGNLAAARDFTDVRDTARRSPRCPGARADRRLQPLLREGAEAGGAGRGDGEGDAAAARESCPTRPLARPADPSIVYGSPDRLREAIGWQPRIPLRRRPPFGRRPARTRWRAGTLWPRRRRAPAPQYPLPAMDEQGRQAPADEVHRTIAPALGPDDPRVFTDSGIEIERLYTEDDVAPACGSGSASRARRPSPAASTRGCTATGSGRCASTPASPLPRTPTSATAT